MTKTNEPRTPTEAQIDANRENAKKSTGPRSAEGKAASSRNRLLHGLRANKHILLDEDPEDFLILLDDLYGRFQPAGDGEEKLVLRIANDQWRLRRAFPMEAGIYRERLHAVAQTDAYHQKVYAQEKKNAAYRGEPAPPAPTPPDEGDLLPRAFNVDCAGPNSLAKLARYESSIEHSIDRCLRQLQKYQAARTASSSGPGHQPSHPPDEPINPETGPQNGAQPAAPPAATPSNSGNYHSNPKNGGIAQFSAAAMALMVYALLHAVPELIAALTSLLTGPNTGHNRPKMNIFHPLAPAANRIRQAPAANCPPLSRLRQLHPGGGCHYPSQLTQRSARTQPLATSRGTLWVPLATARKARP